MRKRNTYHQIVFWTSRRQWFWVRRRQPCNEHSKEDFAPKLRASGKTEPPSKSNVPIPDSPQQQFSNEKQNFFYFKSTLWRNGVNKTARTNSSCQVTKLVKSFDENESSVP